MSTVFHEMLTELRAIRREVTTMAATLADAQQAFNDLNATGQQVLAELQAARTGVDATSLVNGITALNSQFQAVLQPAPTSTPPADGSPQIDPNTGQPVQPV